MIKSKLRTIYYRIFPSCQKELKRAVGNCKTLLNVGCGSNSPIKSFSKNLFSVGIDSFKPSIEKSKKKKIHNKYFLMDVLKIDKKFKPKSFDCVLALDLIEHLKKKDGIRLIKKMEKIAKKKVIIFTPNGFLPQEEYENNIKQVHLSGWSAREMMKKGYKIIGINGLKSLRKEQAEIKFKPKFFWLVISALTQIFVKNNPEKAFQILCIKKINPKNEK